MITKERQKEYEARIAKVEYEIVIEIHKRLIELFKEMKDVQPDLKRSYSGMGSWTIDGKYWVETFDYEQVLEDYPEIKELRRFSDESGTYVVFDATEKDGFDDYIKCVVDNVHRSDENINVLKFMNDACIEFYELYNYIQEINHTTIFDGVNEDGVIVTYGRGACYDTYTEAKESIQVQMLHKNHIPIVFYCTDLEEYYKYVHF